MEITISCACCGGAETYEHRAGRRRKYCSSCVGRVERDGLVAWTRLPKILGPPEPWVCSACGADLPGPQRQRQRCPDGCEIFCVECGGRFVAESSRGPRPMYCSPRCRNAAAPSKSARRRRDPTRCVVCGAWYDTPHRSLCCDSVCAEVRMRQRHAAKADPLRPCRDCGQEFVANLAQRAGSGPKKYDLCPDCALTAERAANARKNAKRRGSYVPGVQVTVEYLGARDGWRCHLCHKPVDRRLEHPHPQSASRDHIVPVSEGGMDLPANLALAHLGCNMDRLTAGEVQMRLIG